MGTDWLTIKTEYINTDISQRKLAAKYGVSFNTLKEKANREKWADAKKERHNRIATMIQQNTEDIIVEKEVNRIARLTSLADRLMDKTEQAINELDSMVVVNTHKVRTVEYNDPAAKGKPTKEIIDETEQAQVVAAMIDRKGLQAVSNTLRNIKDILAFTGDGEEGEDLDVFFGKAGLDDETDG